MDHFLYKDGVLHAEDVPLSTIADAIGTPTYVYSSATLTRHFNQLKTAMEGLNAHIHYAIKANSNQAVLKLLGDLGAGMDVVSIGEYMRARAAGIAPERIVFSGVGKTRAEMRAALEQGIGQFNVESEPEMLALNEIALALNTTAPISFRINPDVSPATHKKIATGGAQTKFGIPLEQARAIYARAGKLKGLRIIGLDVHIGSQITDLTPYRLAYEKLAILCGDLRADGHSITRIDVGGGLGIPYRAGDASASLDKYAEVIRDTLGHLDVQIDLEPGRMIAGNAGILLSRVIWVKRGTERDFLIIDAAMNDLIRPAMYDAYHDIIPVIQAGAGVQNAAYDVVGPICETGDSFAEARLLPPMGEGDLVAFRTAGAYAAVMASEYNTRALVAEVMVKGDQFSTIRPRAEISDIIARDIF